MEKRKHPLVVEHHNGFKDVYVWNKLPGGYREIELYGFLLVTIIVLILLFVDGVRSLESYIGAIFILMLLAGIYKGFQVGIESIGYKPYQPLYFTRLAPNFYIWGNDPAVSIEDNMKIRVRPVSSTSNNEGVVYVYQGKNREIIFMADNNAALEEFASLLEIYYDLERLDDVKK